MSKQKYNNPKKAIPRQSDRQAVVTKPKQDIAAKKRNNRNTIFIIIAIALTAIVYSMSIGNGWIKNWDDGGYVTEHDATSSLSASNIYHLTSHDISRIFSEFYKGNWHPLTTLVYGVEYSFFKADAAPYHFINLVFHLLNVLLVFIFLKKITKKPEIAFIAAALFGIHPMHVESVAWISELKDVMYTFFFLISVISYYNYRTYKEGKTKFYLVSVFAFMFSLLSKSAATPLPLVLLLLDWYMQRKWEWKILIEKIPHFAMSFAIGIAAILSQKSAGAIQDLNPLFAFWERPMLAGYATMMYLLKIFVPIDLVCMYPYPDRINGHLPFMFYVAPFIILGLAFLIYYSRKFSRDIIFGALFFLFTIMLVLQLLPVGGALLAERYSYIPYIGLFMIIGKGYVFSQESKTKIAKAIKYVYPSVLIAGTLVLSFLSFQRIKDWKDGEVLFTDLIKKYPNLPFAYNNRGYLYFNFLKKYDKAEADYTKCISLDSTFHRAYSNRGVLYYNFYGDSKSDSLHLALAIKDFTRALKLKSDNTDALIGRANTYSTVKKFRLSLPDYNNYLLHVHDDSKAYLWRGTAYYNLAKYDSAFADFNKCLEMSPNSDNAYLWRSFIFCQRKDYNAAIKDLDESIRLKPDQFDAYSWRGLAEYNLKMLDKALEDYTIALQKNPKDAPTFINRSTVYYEQKRYDLAFKDYCSAGDLRYALNKEYFFKLKALAGK